jgi:hydrogenase maturation protease
MDVVLSGRTAVIEAIEQDVDGAVKLAVVVEDDPGRDIGFARGVGHRFFFDPSEVQPLADTVGSYERYAGLTPQGLPRPPSAPSPDPLPGTAAPAPPRVLVAGIGNVFLGDDGFGVALAGRLAGEPLPEGVEVRDFGIRGLDLAFAMQDGFDTVVMLDAAPRGQAPGTLYVVEVDASEGEPTMDGHGMDPLSVIALVRAFGAAVPRTLVVGCEPATRMSAADDELVGELSPPVQAALEPALALVRSVLGELTGQPQAQEV